VLDVVLESLRAFHRRVARDSPGGEVVEDDELMAAVVPSCPRRSFPNCVLYDDPAALEARHDELDALYRDAGVEAWTVWVPGDDAAASALERAGHVLDAAPRAMAVQLDALEVPEASFDVERAPGTAEVTALNEAAYGYDEGEFAGLARALEGPDVHRHLVRVDGAPAACGCSLDVGRDCHITLVATAEPHRGRGLARAVMWAAVGEARDRGQRTTSLVATPAGEPVYRRMGYRDFGAVEMWERRRG
jgi:GNAT superfamily N-acetyltransferase